MISLQECISLRKRTELKYGIDLCERNRKTESVSQRAAFISSMMDILRPTSVSTAASINMNHATILHHHANHKYNYSDTDNDFNKLYRHWYDTFSMDIRESKNNGFIYKKALIGYL